MSTLVYWLWKAQHHLVKAPLCGLSTKFGFSWRCTECRYWETQIPRIPRKS